MAQRVVVIATTALVLLVGIRLWFLDGVLRPVTIHGPSMAPAFCGAHYELTCGRCGARFQCDAEHVPRSELAQCFNCGFDSIPLAGLSVRPPDRVLLDRWPLLFRAARRYEVVACRDPNGSLSVKRVAALPGEHLRIVDGHLYDGQQLIPKTHRDVERLRIVAKIPRRTAAEHEQQEQITDYDAYNQGELKRPLNVVRDVWLEVRSNDRRMWRDIYYLDPDGLSRPWQMQRPLATDEYALLGDNQPVSVDSRQWEPAAVKRKDILGVIYRPFWVRPR